MKVKLHLNALLILVIISASQPLYARKNNGRHVNVAINIGSSPKDSLGTNYFSLGFISNIYRLHGVSMNVISSVSKYDMYGAQISGLVNISGKKTAGVQLAGLSNINGGDASGLILSGLVNVTGNNSNGLLVNGAINITGGKINGTAISGLINVAGKDVNGLQIAGLANIVGENTNGVAVAGLMNVNGRDFKGVQASTLLNVNGDETKGAQICGIGNVGVDVDGLQIAGLSNIAASKISGMQLSGLTNIAMRMDKGIQLAPVNITMQKMRGAQFGVGNYSTEISGTQIGLLNICAGEVKGVQIGLINHSKDTSTVKIGLVNVNPQTRIQLMAYGGNTTKTNVAVRFQNKLFYTMLGVGTHFLDLDDKFSGALFYRAGVHRKIINKKFDLSGDLGYYHVENFENESATVPERMYSLQARVNFEYRPIQKLGVFISGGYAVTRHYNKNKTFENKPIIELGIALF